MGPILGFIIAMIILFAAVSANNKLNKKENFEDRDEEEGQ